MYLLLIFKAKCQGVKDEREKMQKFNWPKKGGQLWTFSPNVSDTSLPELWGWWWWSPDSSGQKGAQHLDNNLVKEVIFDGWTLLSLSRQIILRIFLNIPVLRRRINFHKYRLNPRDERRINKTCLFDTNCMPVCLIEVYPGTHYPRQ